MFMKVKQNIWDFLVITFATLITACAIFFFLVPSHVSIGSISGFAIVLSNFIPLSVSALTMIMNIVLLLFGFLTIGREFGVKTVYTSLMIPAIMAVLEIIFPNNQSLTGDQVIDAIGYCVLVNIGVSMLFNRNASSGGIDIIAKFLNKYFHMNFGAAVGSAGMAVALSSALVYDKKTVVLSVLGTYFCGLVLDHFIFGSNIKKRVCIISKKQDKVLAFILHELHSGATKYHAYGAYSDDMHVEINTIVDKNEYLKLIHFINKIDPDAFVTVYTVNEMMYKPKEMK